MTLQPPAVRATMAHIGVGRADLPHVFAARPLFPPRSMSEIALQPDPYAAWRYPDYRRYASSWFLVMFAKYVEWASASYHLTKVYKSHAALAMAMLALVQALPVILLALGAGHIADRFNRRLVLVCSLALSTLSSLLLLTIALQHGSPNWIYVLFALTAVAQALGSPARSALLPQLVPPSEFTNAVTWNSTMFYIGVVTGPVVGGFLMEASNGLALAFALSAACRVLATLGIYLVRYRAQNHANEALTWERLVAGVKFVWNTQLILATITLDLFAVLLGGAVYLLPIYAEQILGVGASGLGFLRAADAIGALCMAIWLAHRPAMKRPGVNLLWAVAGFGTATIVFGVSQWYWLSLLMMFVVGAMDNISVVVRQTLVQMLTPDEMRGRVSAVNNVFIVASNDIGGLESGLVASLFNPVASVVLGGVGTILVVIAVATIWPALLRLGPLDTIRPTPLPEPDLEQDTIA